jgi:hypothetical protein
MPTPKTPPAVGPHVVTIDVAEIENSAPARKKPATSPVASPVSGSEIASLAIAAILEKARTFRQSSPNPWNETELMAGMATVAFKSDPVGRIAAIVAGKIAGPVAAEPVRPKSSATTGRPGRLRQIEGDAKRAAMYAKIEQNRDLRFEPDRLAEIIGVSSSSVRRWLKDAENKFHKSKTANADPNEGRG